MTASHRTAQNDNGHEAAFGELKRALEACIANAGEQRFEQREAALLRIANDAVCAVLTEDLQKRADELPKDVRIDGVLFRRHQRGTVRIHSLCGDIEFTRWSYRRVGERNGPTCVPVELEAGIIDRTTPALAFSVMEAYGRSHMRDHERVLRAAHRIPPSRSTLERVAKSLGTRSKRLVRTVEPIIRQAEKLPAGAHAIVIGLDRTTIPMEEAPTDEHRPVRRCRSKQYTRQPPPPIVVNYRMAYVGTVTVFDCAGEPLTTKRYAVGAHTGAAPLLRRVARDLRHALEAKGDLQVGVVQDGATELRNLMLDLLRAEPLVKKFHIIIDFFHVAERLGLALKLVEPDENRREKQLVRWKRALLRNDHAIYRIVECIKAKCPGWYDNPSKRRAWSELSNHLQYLHGHAFHMRYARMAKLGFPVGSGITEGACKSMIAARLKRSGQRWRPEGVDAVLSLRTLVESGRFSSFWAHFQREHRAIIRAA